MKLLLADVHLWNGESEVFVSGIGSPIQCVGTAVYRPEDNIYEDRSLIVARSTEGKRYFLHCDYEGFKKIELKGIFK